MANPEAGFEIEVASIEELLRLLRTREEEGRDQGEKSLTRKAVFMARMMDRRPSNYGVPLIRRYVVAAFAYGRDRVSYTRTTSNVIELPETLTKTEDRQQAAYEEMRAETSMGWGAWSSTRPYTKVSCAILRTTDQRGNEDRNRYACYTSFSSSKDVRHTKAAEKRVLLRRPVMSKLKRVPQWAMYSTLLRVSYMEVYASKMYAID